MLNPSLTPTVEQASIIAFSLSSRESLVINALAGSAKTTTLEMICRALPVQPILSLAFNRRIAEEMKKRLPGHVNVSTINALGHKIWAQATAKRLILKADKVYLTLKEEVEKLRGEAKASAYDVFTDMKRAVSAAKLNGYVPKGTFPQAKRLLTQDEFYSSFEDDFTSGQIALIEKTLTRSISDAYSGTIDFDDQIYLPCQPSGTRVAVRPSSGQGYIYKDISEIKVGDEVVSFERRKTEFIGMYNHGSKILATNKRNYTGSLFQILAGGKQTVATKEHKWLIRFIPELKRKQLFFTYLMLKNGSFKIGQTQIRSVRPDSSDGLGLAVRSTQEGADAAWILGVYNSLQEAKSAEATIAATFGITDKSFSSEIGREIHEAQRRSDQIISRAKDCLDLFGRDISFPFWRPNVTRGFNSNFITESCNLIDAIMQVPLFEGTKAPNWQTLYTNNWFVKDIEVFSLEVARHELYTANDILTHNCLFGGTFPRFPLVLVDEAQDLSPLNHIMLEKLVTQRLIAVGDPFQSIYAFRGAASRSMKKLTDRFNCTEMTLSVSFRCPVEIVKRAQSRAPGMRWAETAIDGEVKTPGEWNAQAVPENAAIICRNNAPLFKLGFCLLRAGRGINLVGFDIGPGLIRILKKLGPESTPRGEVLTAISKWEQAGLAKSRAKASVRDRADALRVFAAQGETLSAAIAYAEHIFQAKGPIQLMSGHKSKGLEFDVVFHLDPDRIPSPYAETAEELEQEWNIRYVIETRAKRELWLVHMDQFQEG